jgi:FMN-dependent NADH-azoreductase
MSSHVANAFLSSCQQAHPEHEITQLDVWRADLPPFDGELAIAKLAPILGEERTAEQVTAWARVASADF